jgi:hypothetical protein
MALRSDRDTLMRDGAVSERPGMREGKMPGQRRGQADQSGKDSEMKGKYGLQS